MGVSDARLAVDGYSILEGSSEDVLAQHNEELPPDEDPVEHFAEIAGDYPELGSTLMYAGSDLRQEATQATYVIMGRAFMDAADSTIGRKLRSAPRSIGANAIVWRGFDYDDAGRLDAVNKQKRPVTWEGHGSITLARTRLRLAVALVRRTTGAS